MPPQLPRCIVNKTKIQPCEARDETLWSLCGSNVKAGEDLAGPSPVEEDLTGQTAVTTCHLRGGEGLTDNISSTEYKIEAGEGRGERRCGVSMRERREICTLLSYVNVKVGEVLVIVSGAHRLVEQYSVI